MPPKIGDLNRVRMVLARSADVNATVVVPRTQNPAFLLRTSVAVGAEGEGLEPSSVYRFFRHFLPTPGKHGNFPFCIIRMVCIVRFLV